MVFANSDNRLLFSSWRKLSRSANNSYCVGVSVTPSLVGVRDTKDRTGGTLVFDTELWSSFLAMLKRRG
ncbi:DUF397 domain-containing protein [Parasphingorhabdus pacifica]